MRACSWSGPTSRPAAATQDGGDLHPKLVAVDREREPPKSARKTNNVWEVDTDSLSRSPASAAGHPASSSMLGHRSTALKQGCHAVEKRTRTGKQWRERGWVAVGCGILCRWRWGSRGSGGCEIRWRWDGRAGRLAV